MKKTTENQPIFLSLRGREALWRRIAAALGIAALALLAAVAVRCAGAPGAGTLVLRQAEPVRQEAAGTAVLNVNDAAPAELESLPGIGPVLAGRIVAWREENGPFRDGEDLLAVQGIGQGIYEKIRPYITF